MELEEEECIRYFVEYNGFLKFGTFIMFITSLLILMGIYFLCPFNRHRKQFIKKKYLETFYDTRSISADTEFDFQPAFKKEETIKAKPLSIMKPENNVNNNNNNNGKFKSCGIAVEKDNTTTSKNSQPVINNKNTHISAPSNQLQPNGGLDMTSYISRSRGQLKDRVHFDLNNNSSSKLNDREFFSSQSNFEYPPLGKRCSSSQELTYRDRSDQVILAAKPSIVRRSSYTSVPDFNVLRKKELQKQQQFPFRTPEVNRKPQVPYKITGPPVSDADTDEGEMQCTMGYDPLRSSIVVKNLEIQATFPFGVPGFIVEVRTSPKSVQVVRSKVYVTPSREVSVRLDEEFYVKCDHGDMRNCSVVISIIPVLGNLILFAETDLQDVGYLEHGEIHLGGFLKGVFKQS